MHTPCQGGVVGETAVLRRASPANRTLYSVVAKEGKLWSQEEILVVRFKNYVKAGSLSEAYELNQKKSSIVGGGMMWLKLQNRVKMTLIDLSGLGLDTIEETDIAARLANVNMQLSEEAIRYVKENPNEEASVVLIQSFFSDPDDTRKIDELLALLNPRLKDFYLVKELEQYSARAKRTALGAEAPDFSVRNIYGNTVSLDSFPQKYLLLTFTAPWCDMCQTEDLYLDKVAMKYPKDQLDILLVSLDDNPDNVRDVLKKDSIAWNLVTDSAGQAAMLIDLYNVSVLPRCFLIDEDHKILMKTENGIEIKQTLENLFED